MLIKRGTASIYSIFYVMAGDTPGVPPLTLVTSHIECNSAMLSRIPMSSLKACRDSNMQQQEVF